MMSKETGDLCGSIATTVDPAAPGTTQADIARLQTCPKCGRETNSLRCGHCGSQLPEWQANLYAAAVRQIAKLVATARTQLARGKGERERPAHGRRRRPPANERRPSREQEEQ